SLSRCLTVSLSHCLTLAEYRRIAVPLPLDFVGISSMRLYLILICLLGASFHTIAQTHGATQEWLSCGTEEHHIYRMKNDPEYRDRYLMTRHALDSLKRVPAETKHRGAQVFTIPVVVHVIHLGEPIGQQSNISDEQILG